MKIRTDSVKKSISRNLSFSRNHIQILTRSARLRTPVLPAFSSLLVIKRLVLEADVDDVTPISDPQLKSSKNAATQQVEAFSPIQFEMLPADLALFISSTRLDFKVRRPI